MNDINLYAGLSVTQAMRGRQIFIKQLFAGSNDLQWSENKHGTNIRKCNQGGPLVPPEFLLPVFPPLAPKKGPKGGETNIAHLDVFWPQINVSTKSHLHQTNGKSKEVHFTNINLAKELFQNHQSDVYWIVIKLDDGYLSYVVLNSDVDYQNIAEFYLANLNQVGKKVPRGVSALYEGKLYSSDILFTEKEEETIEIMVNGYDGKSEREFKKLSTRRIGGYQKTTQIEIEKVNLEKSNTGHDGEELVKNYLEKMKTETKIENYLWKSEEYAQYVYDFECQIENLLGKISFVIDVKTTKNSFDTDFHISSGELLYASRSNVPYLIYRVYELKDSGGWIKEGRLKISGDVREMAKKIVESSDNLPSGVIPDGFLINVNSPDINWGEEITVNID